jgi:crotonobetainyl-CoA:carnitine CoA-transferase CaiB-like acyl-CoA transferase
MLLADFGADVIKIENPTSGDSLRQWPPITDGFSENFASVNRNKRSVALDLKDAFQRKAAFDLCASADVVIENNRPGVMARLGLGVELKALEAVQFIFDARPQRFMLFLLVLVARPAPVLN